MRAFLIHSCFLEFTILHLKWVSHLNSYPLHAERKSRHSTAADSRQALVRHIQELREIHVGPKIAHLRNTSVHPQARLSKHSLVFLGTLKQYLYASFGAPAQYI